MKVLFLASVLLTGLHASSQYYYKDIIGTRESSDLVKNYTKNNVTGVVIKSYDADNVRSDLFNIEQKFSASDRVLTTITTTPDSYSVLTSYADENGNVIRTVDSSNLVISETRYIYNSSGQLTRIEHNSSDSAMSLNKNELHIWYWKDDLPEKMVRIKNHSDTTFVNFRYDEYGNVNEETSVHRGIKSDPVYYYYDDRNRLTDIVKFNPTVGLLLPEFIFTWSDEDQVIQKYEIPLNNPDYLIWRYQYNDKGLKIREKIYSRNDKKNAVGTVEYIYSFG